MVRPIGAKNTIKLNNVGCTWWDAQWYNSNCGEENKMKAQEIINDTEKSDDRIKDLMELFYENN